MQAILLIYQHNDYKLWAVHDGGKETHHTDGGKGLAGEQQAAATLHCIARPSRLDIIKAQTACVDGELALSTPLDHHSVLSTRKLTLSARFVHLLCPDIAMPPLFASTPPSTLIYSILLFAGTPRRQDARRRPDVMHGRVHLFPLGPQERLAEILVSFRKKVSWSSS